MTDNVIDNNIPEIKIIEDNDNQDNHLELGEHQSFSF